jgi:hypothetical protein
VTHLRATHEEADTRLILHAIDCSRQSNANNIVVSASDTDVLLLLLAHLSEINSNVWMMAGTSKKPKWIPVNEVHTKLPEGSEQCLLQFHALTGCDTTSYLSGHTKKKAYKTFKDFFQLGEGEITADIYKGAETFLCRLYNQSVDSADRARLILFPKARGPELLPPTSDAFRYHVMRVHYQTMVWKQANGPNPLLPEAHNMGWKLENGTLSPILMSLHPIPEACLEMVSCQRSSGCRNLRCKCRKSTLPCTGLCGCDRFSVKTPCINYVT